MGLTGPHDYPNDTITGGLVNPKRLFKKLGALAATGLLALGLLAGVASAASANSSGEFAGGSSGEVNSAGGVGDIEYTSESSSGEVN
ncbi:hypothetical protein [Glycomyces salinus]|uniref:hypothetical protein n=1 Tax=Glycomyces salinus TaxID=980294 RepID=UPI0018EAC52B|nr:hypothetical protein [Glycomyces salinus]